MWKGRQRLLLSFFLMISSCLVAQTQDHGHSHDEDLPERELRIDKNGEINLPSDMRLQDTVLRKGRYRVRHRFDGQDHWFDFEPVEPEKTANEQLKRIAARARAIRIQERNRNSLVYAFPDDHDYRIVKAQLAGESTEYLF